MSNCLDAIISSLRKFSEDELCLDLLHALGKRAYTFEEHDQISRLFFEMRDYDNAIIYLNKTISIAKNEDAIKTSRQNLINCYNRNNFPEKALIEIEKLKTHDHEVKLEESFSYAALNQYEKAFEILSNLIKRDDLPKDVREKALHNMGKFYFDKDDIFNGLKHFIDGGEKEAYDYCRKPNCKKWDGSVTKGKTILIDNACGAGDEIIHIRFMNNIKKLGMNPIWMTSRKDLKEFFEFNGFEVISMFDEETIMNLNDPEWVYSISLPYYLNIDKNNLWEGPYLKTMPEKDKKYEYLNNDKDFKIGFFWNSASNFEQSHFRKLDPEPIIESILNNRENCSIYSLQLNDVQPPKKYKKILKSFKAKDRNFKDTFSIISKMDLIVTSCTSVAHIAASMGKTVCVFVPIMGYHVWISSTGKSWWYGDNVFILKQQKPREWKEPIEQLGKLLKTL